MRPSEALQRHRSEIREIVSRHRARNPRVFGSVVRGEDDETSDLDLLIDAEPEATLFDLGAIQVEAEALLGVRVDVRTPAELPAKFRAEVLRGAVPV